MIYNLISPFLPPLEKFWKNPLVAPPGKTPSDAHGPMSGVRSVQIKTYLRLATRSYVFLRAGECCEMSTQSIRFRVCPIL